MKATGIVYRTLRIHEGGLGCRLGRCFCCAEVTTGHPHPVTYNNDIFRQVLLAVFRVVERCKETTE